MKKSKSENPRARSPHNGHTPIHFLAFHTIELNAKEWADLNDFFSDLREVISSDCNACHMRVTCARDDLLLTRLVSLAAELAKGQVTVAAQDGRQVPISLQVISDKPDAQALVIA